MAAEPLRVAIVGGGIGGLTAAHALTRKGMEVTVHEQAARLGEVGAGIGIMPNGIKLLDRFGLGEEIRAVSKRFEAESGYFHKDGSRVADYVVTDSAGEGGIYGIHRADFVSVLADSLPDGTVRTGQKASGFEQTDDHATLTFENGDRIEADVVIGADGIHSSLRAHVVEPSPAVHSGETVYRGLVPAALVPDWPDDLWEMWMGEGRHFLVFPVRRGELLSYFGYVPSSDEIRESWSAPGDPDQLRAEFAGWEPRVTGFLDKVDSTFWWGLRDREPISRWNNGRLALLGDAAHPMLPHLGQGANQAIEDAAALAALLSRAEGDDPRTALDAYSRLRKDRVAIVQGGSRSNGKLYDAGGQEEIRNRDAELARAATFRWSLYDYDAEAAAEREHLAI